MDKSEEKERMIELREQFDIWFKERVKPNLFFRDEDTTKANMWIAWQASAAAQESPKGEWTHEPPKEPGWYWRQWLSGEEWHLQDPIRLYFRDIETMCKISETRWWSIPISIPPIQTPKESIE